MKTFLTLFISLFMGYVFAENASQISEAISKKYKKCLNNGGQISTQYTAKKHKVYKLCIFEDNRQCEINALNRGWCAVGGVKITGYDNQAQIDCAIRGGQVLATKGAVCTLPSGKTYIVDEQ